MKKSIIFLLVLMLFLTACSETVEDVISDVTSEEISAEESVEDNKDRLYTLVSKGKPYTKSYQANETYPDKFDQQLTDGHKTGDIGAHYVDSRMVGFVSSTTFIIDLGDDGKNIDMIVARSLDFRSDGVAVASAARFAGSADGTKFKSLGTRVFTKTGNFTVSEARLELKENVDYRYIRVTINMGSGAFFFTDEIEVYADVPEKAVPDSVASSYISESIDRNAWKAVSTTVPATPVDAKNLTVGSKYTFENADFEIWTAENGRISTEIGKKCRFSSR